jgi:signal transduction histidine kinase
MQYAARVGTARRLVGVPAFSPAEVIGRLLPPGRLMSALAVGAVLACFVADTLMPRGATPAIGYALVPVLAAGSRSGSFVLGITAGCAVLTAAGFFLEPAGAAWWMSAFDRVLIGAVLGVALLMVLRRLKLIAALAERNQAMARAAEELARSNEELGRFASVVAHDLRGPLSAIALVTELLATTVRDSGAESAEWLAGIRREVDSMTRLIQRLLAYGRVGGGAVRLDSCDCESVLSGVLGSLAATLADARVKVTHDSLPAVTADPVLVAELFQNLIENAVKYRGEDPPHVHVSAVCRQDEWTFSVRDNGVGIGDAHRDAIFQPFTQLAPGGRGTGVGLGLATCKRIVDRHGGRIWVEPTPGGGSTFAFTLGAPPIGSTTASQSQG